jgi:hypothetical protein
MKTFLRPASLACGALILGLLAAHGAAAAAADEAAFPPITDEERALTSVPGEPNAPAVVLFKKGELLMAGYGRFAGSLASHLRVQVRRKILTEAGRSDGEVAVVHSDSLRLQGFSGRTVLPDGRVVPVPADAQFQRRTSEARKTFVTTVAFPAVQVGAILDYQYEVVFSSPYLLEPWYFSEEVPVRHAEIVYRTPKGWNYRIWHRAPLGVKIEEAKQESSKGNELRAWADNLPPVPADPYGPPFADLASQMLLLPAVYSDIRTTRSLLATWLSTSRLLNQDYLQVIEDTGDLPKRAREIAGAGDLRHKAEALYRFVRDMIQTQPGGGVFVDPERSSLRKILAERRGTAVEKALLLQAMLREAGIGSLLVWAADRNRVTIDDRLPYPVWFDTVLVIIELDFERIFLDPASPDAGFGQIRPSYEGTPARIFETARSVMLPETPYDKNLRRAEVDLALDAKGRLAGSGTLRLTGLPAAERLHWKDDAARTGQAWKEWLTQRWRDFRIDGVQVAESAEERKVTVTWSMAQREEETLGDEASVTPSAPLGPATQPFGEAERTIDVIFDDPGRDEVELRLRWPEGWSLDQRPAPAALDGPAGALSSTLALDAERRTLVYRRRFDLTHRRLSSRADYDAVRNLFGEVAKNDAQKLTLVRR